MAANVMTTYWFKPKRYGYGATPVTWQGWAVTGAAVIVIVAMSAVMVSFRAQGFWAWLPFIVVDVIVIAVLLIVCRNKTDGEWRWRWGDR